MDREYFNLWYRLDFEDGHLIWYTDKRDGIVVDSDRGIPTFRSEDALREYAQSQGLRVDMKDSILFDLDLVIQWLIPKTASVIDPSNTLNAWNLFDDVAVSVGGILDDQSESA